MVLEAVEVWHLSHISSSFQEYIYKGVCTHVIESDSLSRRMAVTEAPNAPVPSPRRFY